MGGHGQRNRSSNRNPVDSMIGWITLLKEKEKSEPLDEMEKDVERLKVITERFSKVGSLPELELVDIVGETLRTLKYLVKRSSDLINFESELPRKKILLPLNPQLFSWTLENLIKNGIDAMKVRGP